LLLVYDILLLNVQRLKTENYFLRLVTVLCMPASVYVVLLVNDIHLLLYKVKLMLDVSRAGLHLKCHWISYENWILLAFTFYFTLL